jgi:hypothetical protein
MCIPCVQNQQNVPWWRIKAGTHTCCKGNNGSLMNLIAYGRSDARLHLDDLVKNNNIAQATIDANDMVYYGFTSAVEYLESIKNKLN